MVSFYNLGLVCLLASSVLLQTTLTCAKEYQFGTRNQPHDSRQTVRYGAPNYRPVPNQNLRAGTVGGSKNNAAPNGSRPVGVGAYSFGGMASGGRPANKPGYAQSNGGGPGARPQGLGMRNSPHPSGGYRGVGNAGKPGGYHFI